MAQVTHEFKITGPQMVLTFVPPLGSTTIGRAEDNDLVFVHPLVSRRHARLETTAVSCHLTDLNSTHGTMLNRLRIEPQKPLLLKPGDVIEIGAFRMAYEQIALVQPLAEPAPAPAQEEAEKGEVEQPQPIADSRAAAAAITPPPTTAAPTSRFVPVPPLPPTPPPASAPSGNGRYQPPPGLSYTHSRYLQYLPEIYHTGAHSFITRFLALLESILAPIEWNIDNFDLYLDPKTAPAFFLPWLANWFVITFDESWSEHARRQLLLEAQHIYPRRGTAWALRRVLEIYTGVSPEINDQEQSLEPFTFMVRFPLREQQVNRAAIERIINANKPAHTTYSLIFQA